jgi:sRNA-binding protein
MRAIKHLLVAATLICTSTFATADEIHSGPVTLVSADSITINGEKGEKTLSVSSSTQITGNATAISEVVVGAPVAVRCSDGGTSAIVIRVLPPPEKFSLFSAKVVSVSASSISVKTETNEKTLSIDEKTEFRDFKDASEIKVGDEVGVRADVDEKKALLIRPWPPK